MVFINKAKKSLSNILSIFTKAKAELEAWEALSATEQKDMEQRINLIKQERAKANKTLEALNNILGETKAIK